MIPKHLFYIYYYLKDSPMPLNINHFICIKSQVINNDWDKVTFLTNAPEELYANSWIRRLFREFPCIFEIRYVDRKVDYEGNKIVNLTQESDILRFQTLMSEGGVYMDLDVVSYKGISERYFESDRAVLSVEPDFKGVGGICSACIMAPKRSEYLRLVLEPYVEYDKWKPFGLYELPIYRPYKIARQNPDLVDLRPSEEFCPTYFTYEECEEFFLLPKSDLLPKGMSENTYEIHLWENRNKHMMKYFSEEYFKTTNSFYAQLGRKILNA